MRHTVIGVFDTYAQAEQARGALTAAGFSHGDIELQANPKRDDAAEPSMAPDAETHAEPGMLASIERFFSMLFGGRDQPPEVAHYSEAVRRGAVLIAVDTSTETEVDIARTTLADQGAIDIDERAASWGALEHGTSAEASAEGSRDHSLLDELGLGRGSGVPGRDPVDTESLATRAESNRARAYPRADVGNPAVEPVIDPLADPLGNPLRPQDPVSLSSRDIFTETPAEPLGPLDMPAAREDTLARGTAGRDPLSAQDIGSPAQRDAMSPTSHASVSERDALAGADPLAPLASLDASTPVSDVPARDALGGIDALTGRNRDPLTAGTMGSPAQRDPLSPASGTVGSSPATPASDALGGRDATYRYEAGSPASPDQTMEPGTLSGTSAESARDWRPVDSIDKTDVAANDAFAARGIAPDASDASRMSAASAGGYVPGAVGPQTIPDEYMEYSDDFRSDYDSKYASTGSRFEDYEGAYRYGATLGNDDRFRSRQWDDQMEYEMRRDWESCHPDNADTWDRFKAAIRHGWDRVTGHHHV